MGLGLVIETLRGVGGRGVGGLNTCNKDLFSLFRKYSPLITP